MATSSEKSEDELNLKEPCNSQMKIDSPEFRMKHPEGSVLQPRISQCVACEKDIHCPQLLPCLHSICRGCIPFLTADDSSTVVCPWTTCSAKRPVGLQEIVPNGPLERFVKGHRLLSSVQFENKPLCSNRSHQAPGGERAEAMAYCPKCDKYFCKGCHASHETFREDMFQDHQMKILGGTDSCDNEDNISSAFVTSPSPSPCPAHQGQTIDFFCEQCDTLLCQVCVLENHMEHKPKYLHSYTFPPGQNSVSVLRKILLDWESRCLQRLSSLERKYSTLKQAEQAAHKETEELFLRLSDTLEERKVKLLQEIALAAAKPTNSLMVSTQKLEACLTMVRHSRDVMQFFTEHASTPELLLLRRVASQQVDLVHDAGVEAVSVVPAHSTALKVLYQSAEDSICQLVAGLGVVDRGPDPSRCQVTPALSGVVHKMPTSGPLQLCVSCPRALYEASFCHDNVTAFFRSPAYLSPPIRGTCVASGDGQSCFVTFHQFYTGQCELDVLFDGCHISGSPFVFSLAVPPDLSQPELLKRVLSLPPCAVSKGDSAGYSRLAVSSKGIVFVSDNIRNVIHKLDSRMNYLGVVEACSGVLDHPRAVALDANECLYVAHSHVVSVFGPRLLHTIGRGQLNYPWDVAVGPSGEVFVSDTGNHRIVVFDAEGANVLRTFGSKGSGVGHFTMPGGLAFFPTGNLVVSDTQNNRLQVFTPEGRPLYEFSSKDLVHPRQIVTTIEGFVFCACTGSHSVLVFDSRGKKIASLGKFGRKLGQFRGPKGIAVSLDGHLLVCEGEGYRVQSFWRPF